MHDRIDGMTYEQTRYNVYAFKLDIRSYTRQRDKARTPHTREVWEKKIAHAHYYLNKNEVRLRQFGQADAP